MGDPLLRWTVRLAFVCYIAALALRITPSNIPTRQRLPIFLWTAGCVLFLIHVWAAFQYVHHWSHADAFRETARQTQLMTGLTSGAGLWLNYLFAAVWALHSGYGWIKGKRPRARWVERSIQAFFAFMWFNATIVFGQGFARWMGIAGAVVLLVTYAMRQRRRSSS